MASKIEPAGVDLTFQEGKSLVEGTSFPSYSKAPQQTNRNWFVARGERNKERTGKIMIKIMMALGSALNIHAPFEVANRINQRLEHRKSDIRVTEVRKKDKDLAEVILVQPSCPEKGPFNLIVRLNDNLREITDYEIDLPLPAKKEMTCEVF